MSEAEEIGLAEGQRQIDHLTAENAEFRSKLEAAEGRIERARETLGFPRDPHRKIAQAFAILSEPANAEGIASEGGSAQAANPRDLGTDAPSAEAGDWQALAGELSLALTQMTQDARSIDDFAQARQVQARYYEAIGQHDEEPRG